MMALKESGGPLCSISPNPTTWCRRFMVKQFNKPNYTFMMELISTLAGPVYTAQQGKSGFETVTALDTQNNSKTTVRFFIGGTLVGVFANEEFTPSRIHSSQE